MKKYEKILLVLLFGSLWGALELFGRDFLRSIGMPHKSAVLFGLGIIVLYASKRVIHFPGSVVIMALIAGVFKSASARFFPCQFTAVLIDGIVFDAAYTLFKDRLDSKWIYRTIAAPIIVYIAFTGFALMAAFVLWGEGSWRGQGWPRVGEFLATSALAAAIVSMVTIHLGYLLGNVLRPYARLLELPRPTAFFRIAAIAVVAVIWIAGIA